MSSEWPAVPSDAAPGWPLVTDEKKTNVERNPPGRGASRFLVSFWTHLEKLVGVVGGVPGVPGVRGVRGVRGAIGELFFFLWIRVL